MYNETIAYEKYLNSRGIQLTNDTLEKYGLVLDSDSDGPILKIKWRSIDGNFIQTCSTRKLYTDEFKNRYKILNWDCEKNIRLFIPRAYNGAFPSTAWLVEGEIKTISVVENLKIHAFGFTGVFGLTAIDVDALKSLGLKTVYACYDNDVFKRLTLMNAVLRAKKLFENAGISFFIIDRHAAKEKGIDDELAAMQSIEKNEIVKNYIINSKNTIEVIKECFDFKETSYSILPYFLQTEATKYTCLKTDAAAANAQKTIPETTLISKIVQTKKVADHVTKYTMEILKETSITRKAAAEFYVKNCLKTESRTTTIIDYTYNPDYKSQTSIVDFENETRIVSSPLFPIRRKDSTIDDLLLHLFNDDEKTIEYIKKWAAFCIFGNRKMETVLMLHSLQQGSGKSNFAKIISKVIGAVNAIILTQSRILQIGKFNSFIIGKRLIVFDDIILRNNAETAKFIAEFNAVVTSNSVLIEKKGQEPYMYKTNANYIATTNTDLGQIELPGGFQRRLVIPSITSLSALEIKANRKLDNMFTKINKAIMSDDVEFFNNASAVFLDHYDENFNEYEWLECDSLVDFANKLLRDRFGIYITLFSNLKTAGWPYAIISAAHLISILGVFLNDYRTESILQTIYKLQRNKLINKIEHNGNSFYTFNYHHIPQYAGILPDHTEQAVMYTEATQKIDAYIIKCITALTINKIQPPECKLRQISMLR